MPQLFIVFVLTERFAPAENSGRQMRHKNKLEKVKYQCKMPAQLNIFGLRVGKF